MNTWIMVTATAGLVLPIALLVIGRSRNVAGAGWSRRRPVRSSPFRTSPRELPPGRVFTLNHRPAQLSLEAGRTRVTFPLTTIGSLLILPRVFQNERPLVASGDVDFDRDYGVSGSQRSFTALYLADERVREAVASLRDLAAGTFAWPGLRVEAAGGELQVELSRPLRADAGELGEFMRLSSRLAQSYEEAAHPRSDSGRPDLDRPVMAHYNPPRSFRTRRGVEQPGSSSGS